MQIVKATFKSIGVAFGELKFKLKLQNKYVKSVFFIQHIKLEDQKYHKINVKSLVFLGQNKLDFSSLKSL